MKKMIALALCLIFMKYGISQNPFPLTPIASAPTGLTPADDNYFQQLKQSRQPSASINQRGLQNVTIDYDFVDEQVTNNTAGTYRRLLWPLNANFDPNDSTAFGLTWAVQRVDSLFDATTLAGVPYNTSAVTIDSIDIYFAHQNTTGTPDTIIASVYQWVPPFGVAVDSNENFINPILFSDTIITSFSLTPSATQSLIWTLYPDLQLSQGEKFLAGVNFYGDTANTFNIIAGYGDRCNGACGAFPSAFDINSIWRLIYWQNGVNYTGINSLSYDCNANSTYDPANCEAYLLQNYAFVYYLTLDVPTPQANVRLLRADPVTDEVTIKNFGSVSLDISGYYLCSEIVYSQALSNLTLIGGNLNLGAGDTVRVSGFSLDETGADLGLYINANNFADPANMADFTQWLSAGNGRETVAVAKGIWSTGDFITANAPYRYTGNGNQDGVNFWQGAAPPVCTPSQSTGTPGLSPDYSTLACVEQGMPFDEVISIENFSTINVPLLGTVTINSLQIDSITNLPCNLQWETNKPDNTFGSGETGCINITGTSNDEAGQYKLGIWVTMDVGAPINNVVSGEVCDLTAQYGATAIKCDYYLRVKETAQACAPVDTQLAGRTACGGGLQPGECDTLRNYNLTDSLTVYINAGGGYVSGHNSYGDLGKADKFTNTAAGAEVSGAYYGFGIAKFGNPNAFVTAAVWDNAGAGGSPGNMLTSENVLISDIASAVAANVLIYVPFSTPAVVNSDFYVGITFTYSSGDTVALFTNQIGDGTTTAWEQWSDSTWKAYIDTTPGASSWGFDISHAILPIICVPEPCPSLNITFDSTDAFCAQAGSAIVTASAGSAPYSYLWSHGPTDSSIINLVPGDYTVTVTDDNGCMDSATVTINNSSINLTINTSFTNNTSCNAPNGTATAVPANGTGSYTYLWDSGTGSQDTATASNLAGGTYTVTVFDANGCTGTGSVTINDAPPVVTVSINSVTDNTACSNYNGSATVSGSGGAAPYIYLWDGAAGNQDSATATGLAGGTYFVTATDVNGCSGSTTVSVGENLLTLTINILSTTPNNSCTSPVGSATVMASGGAGSYTYAWGNNTGNQTGDTASALQGGTYAVTATDTNGCTGDTVVTVATTTPSISIALTDSNANISCTTPNGSLTVMANGGNGSYTYQWDAATGNQTGNVVTGLGSGSYSVTATDTNGCPGMETFAVNDSTPDIEISPTVTPVSCFGEATGMINLAVTPATGSYTFSWHDSTTGQNRNGLTAGNYGVTVIDANGCRDSLSNILVSEPPLLMALITVTNESSSGASDGTATGFASGGTPPYQYAWDTGDTSQMISGLIAGPYCVTITDDLGCDTVLCDTVETTVGVKLPEETSQISLFPNPTKGEVTMELSLNSAETVMVEWYNIIGERILAQEVSLVKKAAIAFDLSPFANGIYFTRITFGENSVVRKVNLNR